MVDKAKQRTINALKAQIKEIQRSGSKAKFETEVAKYNSIVRGVHNYYSMATNITEDCQDIHNSIYKMLYNRLKPTVSRIPKTSGDYGNYKDCKRVMKVQGRHLLPISYCSYRQPLGSKQAANIYTPEGRKCKHKNLSFTNSGLIKPLSENPIAGKSVEYNDNRISLFSAQYGKCAITGQEFLSIDEIHCHHKVPTYMGGKDNYQNLVLVLPEVHRLIHAKRKETIQKYLDLLKLDKAQIQKLDKLRKMAGLEEIERETEKSGAM